MHELRSRAHHPLCPTIVLTPRVAVANPPRNDSAIHQGPRLANSSSHSLAQFHCPASSRTRKSHRRLHSSHPSSSLLHRLMRMHGQLLLRWYLDEQFQHRFPLSSQNCRPTALPRPNFFPNWTLNVALGNVWGFLMPLVARGEGGQPKGGTIPIASRSCS